MADTLSELSRRVVKIGTQRGLTVATAESLTAGLCAATLADTPGASAVLRGGFVVYATDLKRELADVDPALLEDQGPVDPTVAEQLARGAAQRCDADVGVGLTGVAGPDEQDGHPVGQVFIGVAFHGKTSVQEYNFAQADRPTIRQLAVQAALIQILDMIAEF